MLDEKDLDQIASLARIGIETKDKPRYVAHLNNLLIHFDNLNKVDVTALEETAWMGGDQSRFREDSIRESLSVDKVLQNASRKMVRKVNENEDGYFEVGRIIE